MLHFLFVLVACTPGNEDTASVGLRRLPTASQDTDTSNPSGDGTGGAGLGLTLPFPSGEYWQLTQSYNQGSHVDYGFRYSDDSWALDFSQEGCEAYGKTVTPLMEGFVQSVSYSDSDEGYGNTILIEHNLDGPDYVTRYAHLSQIFVGEGQWVSIYDPIGAVGDTGKTVGVKCAEHPGTHLHVALYEEEGDGVRPEPLSGVMPLLQDCWYSREGNESCEGRPADYDDGDTSIDPYEGVDGEGELNIAFLDISPDEGSAGETEYVWASIIVSPDFKPDATLHIYNPLDAHTYEFEMETASSESPWVFTYRKSLNSATTYTYWVKASNGDGNDTTGAQNVLVNESTGETPVFYSFDSGPDSGEAEDTYFSWASSFTSGGDPEAVLNIVNPNDAVIYRFEMLQNGADPFWTAAYSKTLRDATTYTYWVEVDNGDTVQSTELGYMVVND